MSHHSSNNTVTMSDGTQVNLGSDSTGAQDLQQEVGKNNQLKMELAFLEGMQVGEGAGGNGGGSGSSGLGGNYGSDVVDPFSNGSNTNSSNGSNGSNGNSVLNMFQDINNTVSSVGSQLAKA